MRVRVVFRRKEVEDKLIPMPEPIDTVLGGEWLLGKNPENRGLIVKGIDLTIHEFKVGFVMPREGKLVRGKVISAWITLEDAPVLRFELTDSMPEGACLLERCIETGEWKVERTAMVRLYNTRLALGATMLMLAGGIGGRDALPETLRY